MGVCSFPLNLFPEIEFCLVNPLVGVDGGLLNWEDILDFESGTPAVAKISTFESVPFFSDISKRVQAVVWSHQRSTTSIISMDFHLCLVNNLSGSAAMAITKEMKEAGFPIDFCKISSSYYYAEEGKMVSTLFEKEINKEEMKDITGAKSFFNLFLESDYTGL